MKAIQLVGHGGLDKLVLRNDIPAPNVAQNEVLIKVGACAINNTDIWTRLGAYGSESTQTREKATGWQRSSFHFPRIQGVDIAGTIVEVGSDILKERIGQRVLVDHNICDEENGNRDDVVLIGSERDGGFAEYCSVPASNAIAINSDYTDAEIASFPCAYGTALGMINKASVSARDTVLITGASGGVGSALVQLCKMCEATTIAVVSSGKEDVASELGADFVIVREKNLEDQLNHLDRNISISVAADVVGGESFPALLNLLCYRGSYVTAGAIAGPITELDLRTLYLKELKLLGSTGFSHSEFADLVSYIENKKIQPTISKTYPLEDIHQAQQDFMDKKFFGKLVLIP